MTGARQTSDGGLWQRSTWMRLGAVGAVLAVFVLLVAPIEASDLRLAAQVGFMHAMSTFACATFMNIGARAARHAPLCFVLGSMCYCLPVYLNYLGATSSTPILKVAGAAILLTGWGILIWSTSGISRTTSP
jgi:uncharacterized membrane protein YgdD (TMEM256/DUF423 family)